MNQWSLTSLLAEAPTRDVTEFVTELRRVPEGWAAVGGLALLAALCAVVVGMYRHEGRIGASPRARRMMAGVRCLVLLLLAVILLEPVRVRILRRWIDSYTIVLVDESSSMDLADAYRDEGAAGRVRRVAARDPAEAISRTSLVRRLLERDDRRFLTALADNNRVKLHTFSDEPQLRATIAASRERIAAGPQTAAAPAVTGVEDVPLTWSATGPATNIERAVRRAVEALGSAPIAAVIVLSDGGFNQGAPAEEVAQFARERRIPIHAVGVGDPSAPYNVRVTEVLAPTNAFQQDPFSITARLAAEGLEGQTVNVQLRERDATAGGTAALLETKSASIGPGGSVSPVTFTRQQNRVGRFIYTVGVPPLVGETVSDDNVKQTTVNVIDSRTRVLLVAGGPSWDYRYVARLLTRDRTFDVSCWLQSADLAAVRDGNTIIDHLPATAEELFEYDVVVLLDPDAEEFDESWCRLLDTLVSEYGGGLLMAAGRPHTPAFFRRPWLKPLHDLLPVVPDPEADLVLNEIGYYQTSPAPVEVPLAAHGHPAMKMADDPASSKLIWRRLGEVHWHYPVLREKPVATVLMRHGHPRMRNAYGGQVLAAVQFVGAGRTGFLAFDGTWRWRRFGAETHDRFWVQLIRYLAEGKLLGGTKRGMLTTESEQFALGEAVTVIARLLDRQYKPLTRDRFSARYGVDSEKGEFELVARRDRPGWYEGRFVPDRVGHYQISMRMPQPGANDPVEITHEIVVTRPNIEILRPQMDRASLMTLAEQSHGGKYVEVDEIDELPSLIPDLHEEIPIRSRPTSLWDRWPVLLLLVGLLSLEWGLRKWHRLL